MDTKNDIGFIYVMHLIDPNNTKLYKIGHCDINRQRLGEYTQLMYDVEYPLMYKTINRKKYEKELHEIFKTKRLRGEWFQLSDDDLKIIEEYFKNKKCERVKYGNIKKQTGQVHSIHRLPKGAVVDGYDNIYIVCFSDGILKEQDCGKMAFAYGNTKYVLDIGRNPKRSKDVKTYYGLSLDTDQISKNHIYIYKSKKMGFRFKAIGNSRKDCFEKLYNLAQSMIKKEDEKLSELKQEKELILELSNELMNQAYEKGE